MSRKSASESTSDIIQLIHSIKERGNEILNEKLRKREIPEEVYHYGKRVNEELFSKILSEVLTHSSNKSGVIVFERRAPEWKIASIMVGMIRGYSHDRKIVQLANKIMEEYSKAKNYPTIWSPSQTIYRDHFTSDFPYFKPKLSIEVYENEFKSLITIFQHYIGVAKAVEDEVRSIIDYREEPDDEIKAPTVTLNEKYGDCDDFTVLIGSLWRALNFLVCLGLMSGHAYPVVVLPSLRIHKKDENKDKVKVEIDLVLVPGDNVKLPSIGISIYELLYSTSKIHSISSNELEELERYGKSHSRFFPVHPLTSFNVEQCQDLFSLVNESLKLNK